MEVCSELVDQVDRVFPVCCTRVSVVQDKGHEAVVTNGGKTQGIIDSV